MYENQPITTPNTIKNNEQTIEIINFKDLDTETKVAVLKYKQNLLYKNINTNHYDY
jgi:hypothetical protein